MNDLIRRSDAIKEIRKCKFESDMPADWYYGMETAQDIVDKVPSAEAVQGWIPVRDIRKLQDILLIKIDSFEGTRNIVEKGMLEAWKDVAEYIDGVLKEGGEDE